MYHYLDAMEEWAIRMGLKSTMLTYSDRKIMVTSINRRGWLMPTLRNLLLLSLLLFFASPSFSQHMNEPDSPCSTVVSTRDLTNCLFHAKTSSDSELNSQCREIQKRLEGDSAKRLITTQKFWMQYRDANCEAERELYGPGTGSGPAYLACMGAITRERTKELRVTYAVILK